MKLIDKDKVVEEIERLNNFWHLFKDSTGQAVVGNLLSFLDNLEVKEVDLKQEEKSEALREFRGYLNGRLLYTFPLHWVDNIKVKDGVMIVSYYDEMQYNAETGEDPLVEIRVDDIDVK